jgi:hypothetical protein
VLAHDNATFGLPSAVAALKADPTLSWIAIAVIAEIDLLEAARSAGADIVIARGDVARLSGELARTLAVS